MTKFDGVFDLPNGGEIHKISEMMVKQGKDKVCQKVTT
jgi:hypothetical protein